MPIQFKHKFFEKKLLYCHKVIRIPNFNLWIIWIILYNLPEVQANSCSVHSPSFRVLLICDLQWFGSSSDLSGQSTLWSHRHNFEMQWIPKCSRNFDLLYFKIVVMWSQCRLSWQFKWGSKSLQITYQEHSTRWRMYWVLLICDLQWFGSSSDLSGQSTLWSHRHNFEMQWIPKCSRNFDLLYLCLFQVILGLDFVSWIFIKNFQKF